MNDLGSVAETLRKLRHEAKLSQAELARRAQVARVTLARMEAASTGDMSVSTLTRLLTALGYELNVRPVGHQRTLEDILAEQRAVVGGGSGSGA